MKIEIEMKKEPLVIYAISLAGWGKGKTIAEALRNMYSASRGWCQPENIIDDLEHQRIAIYLSNETDGIDIDNFSPRPSEGKWVLHLGDEFNDIKAYGHIENK